MSAGATCVTIGIPKRFVVMRVSWAVRSDPGRRRPTNEDSYCARADLGLFIVADGMGGHVAGEVASRIAVEQVERFVDGSIGFGPQDTWPVPIDPDLGRDGNRLRAGLELASRRIAEQVAKTKDLRGMATTAVALLVGSGRAALAHVGDSRAYLRRANELTRLTRDHSWVEEQMQAGMLSADAARDHPWRNIVTRALSGSDSLEIEVTEVPVAPGDRLLLCSDGLSTVLPDDKIEAMLGRDDTLDAVCAELVRGANDGGGPDNVTALIVDVDAD